MSTDANVAAELEELRRQNALLQETLNAKEETETSSIAAYGEKLLTKSSMDAYLQGINYTQFEVEDASTLNEGVLLKKIEEAGVAGHVAFGLAVIVCTNGYTNRQEIKGKVSYRGHGLVAADIAKSLKIKSIPQNVQDDESLTFSRLCRIFRYNLSAYYSVEGTKKSHLYRKWGYQVEGMHPGYCFMGAEYLIEPGQKKEAENLQRAHAIRDREEVKSGKQKKDDRNWEKGVLSVFLGKGITGLQTGILERDEEAKAKEDKE